MTDHGIDLGDRDGSVPVLDAATLAALISR
jgi:hypothetical protein